jgi:hypothetical protein
VTVAQRADETTSPSWDKRMREKEGRERKESREEKEKDYQTFLSIYGEKHSLMTALIITYEERK